MFILQLSPPRLSESRRESKTKHTSGRTQQQHEAGTRRGQS